MLPVELCTAVHSYHSFALRPLRQAGFCRQMGVLSPTFLKSISQRCARSCLRVVVGWGKWSECTRRDHPRGLVFVPGLTLKSKTPAFLWNGMYRGCFVQRILCDKQRNFNVMAVKMTGSQMGGSWAHSNYTNIGKHAAHAVTTCNELPKEGEIAGDTEGQGQQCETSHV